MSDKEWEQFWVMGSLRLNNLLIEFGIGGSGVKEAVVKGKGKTKNRSELNEDFLHTLIQYLHTLLSTLPSPPRPPPPINRQSILFISITSFLDIIRPSSCLALQTRTLALEALYLFLENYAFKDQEFLLKVLPGLMSTLNLTVLNQRGKSEVIELENIEDGDRFDGRKFGGLPNFNSTLSSMALEVFGKVLNSITLPSSTKNQKLESNKISEGQRHQSIWEISEDSGEQSLSLNLETLSHLPSESSNSRSDIEGLQMMPFLAPLFQTFSTLFLSVRVSQSPQVRESLVKVIEQILTFSTIESNIGFIPLFNINESLLEKSLFLISETLLLLTTDDFPSVASPAKDLLSSIRSHENFPLLAKTIPKVLSTAISDIPTSINKKRFIEVDEKSKIITAGTRFLNHAGKGGDLGIEDVELERWTWRIVKSLDRIGVSGGSNGALVEEMGSFDTAGESKPLANGLSNGSKSDILSLSNLSDSSSQSQALMTFPSIISNPDLSFLHNSLSALFISLSSLPSPSSSLSRSPTLSLIDRFFSLSLSSSSTIQGIQMAERSMWIAERLFAGLAQSVGRENEIQKSGKEVRKWARRYVIEVLEAMERDWDHETEENKKNEMEKWDDGEDIIEEGRMLQKDEIKISSNQIVTVSTSTASSEVQLRSKRISERNQALISSHLLRILTHLSSILGTSFRNTFLHTLYPIVSFLVSPSPLVVSTSKSCLYQIAYNSGYASPINLLSENFDYLINSVSLRLSPITLCSQDANAKDIITTPKVLKILIRLVGTEKRIEELKDVVEDLLEMVDTYGGYGVVSEGVWDVLGEVVRVLSEEQGGEEGNVEEVSKERFVKGEDPEIARFRGWLNGLDEEVKEEFIRDPNKPLSAEDFKIDRSDPEVEDEPVQEEEKPLQPAKSRLLLLLILAKAPYFLSSSSSSLRLNLLRLLSSCVPLLKDKATYYDLLPQIHKFWPSVVARISVDESFEIVEEAMALVGELAKEVGEFVGRRVEDDIWPRVKSILDKLEQEKSKGRMKSRYTVSNRFYWSMLETFISVASNPSMSIKDPIQWEIIIRFREFLSENQEIEIQEQAVIFYENAGRNWNDDAIWLALEGAVEENGYPKWLTMSKELKMERNVKTVVERLKKMERQLIV